ncbi:CaiB/BaiF CoA transferase family protein [Pontibacillus litoralis]|uniref:CoA-transferase family III n=1 Tax=Pontibacillus litoralis JSM 072002 TaxID=1385512 RepID=A0A0A5HQZ9_9BACI|nr:CoA transferase [Pontibacillus litoralis]KGX86002.1 CoA-transferase family III [Pontibacillus litoralis JSM 072002]
MKPLEGVRVLDFTRVLAGPFSTKILADFGAEVIKIEKSGLGDDTRSFGPFQNGLSGYFVFLNSGKKSVELNLKDEKSIQLIKQLVKDVDVVVENFRPGVMKKFGLDYMTLKKEKEDLIYASISGFGQSGVWHQKPAYDLIAQAIGGIMSINGYEDTPPTRVGSSLGDTSAGLYLTIGILTALFHRSRTGEGQQIDVAMADTIYSLLESNIMRYTVDGETPHRIGNRHPISAPLDTYKAKNGYLAIAIANDALFNKFAQVMNREDLIEDSRFYTDFERAFNQKALKLEIENWLKNYSKEQAALILDNEGIPCAEIYNIKEISESNYIKERNMLVQVDQQQYGEFTIPGNPIKLSSLKDKNNNVTRAPALGEHTEELMDQYMNQMVEGGRES